MGCDLGLTKSCLQPWIHLDTTTGSASDAPPSISPCKAVPSSQPRALMEKLLLKYNRGPCVLIDSQILPWKELELLAWLS